MGFKTESPYTFKKSSPQWLVMTDDSAPTNKIWELLKPTKFVFSKKKKKKTTLADKVNGERRDLLKKNREVGKW